MYTGMYVYVRIHVLHLFSMYVRICITHTASTEQIDKAKEIMKKLTFKYQPDAFENPGVPSFKCQYYW